MNLAYSSGVYALHAGAPGLISRLDLRLDSGLINIEHHIVPKTICSTVCESTPEYHWMWSSPSTQIKILNLTMQRNPQIAKVKRTLMTWQGQNLELQGSEALREGEGVSNCCVSRLWTKIKQMQHFLLRSLLGMFQNYVHFISSALWLRL